MKILLPARGGPQAEMALDMRARVGQLAVGWERDEHELGFGVGIARGYATLGRIGFEGRFDYAAIGTVTNMAARLCDAAAPDQILINQRVYTAVESLVQAERVGDLTLKGLSRPIPTYNVLGLVEPG